MSQHNHVNLDDCRERRGAKPVVVTLGPHRWELPAVLPLEAKRRLRAWREVEGNDAMSKLAAHKLCLDVVRMLFGTDADHALTLLHAADVADILERAYWPQIEELRMLPAEPAPTGRAPGAWRGLFSDDG